ncbi:MAG: hypothetical protein HUN04_12485 [Desulfobacter sp.]|nr:MAG: hypothetical protein HUN04_12485 [Desulfobacter sp.]
MKIYHQLGHNHKWALDAYFENGIGDGFVFCAYSFPYGKIETGVSKYGPSEYMDRSMIDLQFYGSKRTTENGKLHTYPFNPINLEPTDSTMISGTELIEKAIRYQETLSIKDIIVPVFYHELSDLDQYLTYLRKINKIIIKRKKQNGDHRYYMTVPFSNDAIIDEDYVEDLLQALTDMPIAFDGYYIVCDAKPEYKKKVSIDYDYYENLIKTFNVLNKQGFKTVYGYANWDALIFATLCNIDCITIGTYENLRNFNIQRYTEIIAGGPSQGWYFSEKLLNFIRAQELKNLRRRKCLDLIANDKNIFSDIILKDDFPWNTHKPDVHKNYLLAISRLYQDISGQKSIRKRVKFLQKRIDAARNLYATLETKHRVFLNDESSDYHLGAWDSIIKMHA